ncbi:Nuclear receptor corepressor 2, partial [Ophiophagus hannah]
MAISTSWLATRWGSTEIHNLPFLLWFAQEKERNSRRKKKKSPAIQNEERAFPPVTEDEEMGQDGSGTSGNEEEMAEEDEAESLGPFSLEPGVPNLGNFNVCGDSRSCQVMLVPKAFSKGNWTLFLLEVISLLNPRSFFHSSGSRKSARAEEVSRMRSETHHGWPGEFWEFKSTHLKDQVLVLGKIIVSCPCRSLNPRRKTKS